MIDKMNVYQDTELSSKAVSVYLYLCERASKETKSCYPSMKTIAKDLHLSLASVKRSIQELERSAYIKKENRVFFIDYSSKPYIYLSNVSFSFSIRFFSVYYVTVKVNSSHSRLTLSHTIAHAEDRPPPLAFFIVF